MPTSAPGSRSYGARRAGFTLLELLVVVAIVAIASAGVSFALRDAQGAQLEREAQRLASLLESARAQSRLSGQPVRWRATEGAFTFDGLPPEQLPRTWLVEGTQVLGTAVLVLGPEPIIGPQSVVLGSSREPGRRLGVATDGLRPFHVTADAP
jgi:general secretion pathway protein H